MALLAAYSQGLNEIQPSLVKKVSEELELAPAEPVEGAANG